MTQRQVSKYCGHFGDRLSEASSGSLWPGCDKAGLNLIAVNQPFADANLSKFRWHGQRRVVAGSTHSASCHKAVVGRNCQEDERRLTGTRGAHIRPDTDIRLCQLSTAPTSPMLTPSRTSASAVLLGKCMDHSDRCPAAGCFQRFFVAAATIFF